jgi:hypothetical protein
MTARFVGVSGFAEDAAHARRCVVCSRYIWAGVALMRHSYRRNWVPASRYDSQAIYGAACLEHFMPLPHAMARLDPFGSAVVDLGRSVTQLKR